MSDKPDVDPENMKTTEEDMNAPISDGEKPEDDQNQGTENNSKTSITETVSTAWKQIRDKGGSARDAGEEMAHQATERDVDSWEGFRIWTDDADAFVEGAEAGLNQSFTEEDGPAEYAEEEVERWVSREQTGSRDTESKDLAYEMTDFTFSQDSALVINGNNGDFQTMKGEGVSKLRFSEGNRATSTEEAIDVLQNQSRNQTVDGVDFELTETLREMEDSGNFAEVREGSVDDLESLMSYRRQVYQVARDTKDQVKESAEETAEMLEVAQDEGMSSKQQELIGVDKSEMRDIQTLRTDQQNMVETTADDIDSFYNEQARLNERAETIQSEVEELVGENGLMEAIFSNYRNTADPITQENEVTFVDAEAKENLEALYGAFENKIGRIGGPVSDEYGLLDRLVESAQATVDAIDAVYEDEEFGEEVEERSNISEYEDVLEQLDGEFLEIEETETGKEVGYSENVQEMADRVETYSEAKQALGEEETEEVLGDVLESEMAEFGYQA